MSEHDPLNRPRVTDNDRGAIVVTFEGRQIRLWTYQGDDARRKKMMYAREYIEGWCDGRDHGLRKLFLPG
jgi:hypothetical protein